MDIVAVNGGCRCKAPEGKITGVTLLGNAGELEFTQDDQGLKVKLPAQGAMMYAYALKISDLKTNPPAIRCRQSWRI